MVLQGWAWKKYIIDTNREELPRVWGWSLTVMGAGGVGVRVGVGVSLSTRLEDCVEYM